MVDAEVFVGFESGAIGMFKIMMDEKAGEYSLRIVKLFTGQKVIQDTSCKHVLSMAVTHLNPLSPDFTLSVGYYSSLMQTLTFIEGYKQDSYTVMDQTITEPTYHEKPGIGVVSTLRFKNMAALMATGGFDHRIKLVSLKTLK